MRNILSIARSTMVVTFRNRILYLLALFALLLLGASLLLSLLGQEQAMRILLDLGLASIELLSFFAAVFLMSNLILEEIDSRAIYLVLTRATTRFQYLAGRFLGTLAAVFLCGAAMTALHLLLLFWKGWRPETEGALYVLSLFMSLEKIVLISSLALFFSLFSSSGVVAWVFTLFFWILGHFAMELKFLAGEMQAGFARSALKGAYLLLPHFQYLNARDLWIAAHERLSHFALYGSLYTLLYGSLAFGAALFLFRRKEF